MLEVQNLAVRYRDTEAISSVSFSLQPGQLTGLFGPNGAGKSTLLKAILGLIPVTSGVVKFCSKPLKSQLRRVAYVPQRNQIDWDYPIAVRNVVMMGRTVHTGWFREPSRQSKEIAIDALKRVGMLEYRNRQIGELSGGQQQRVFLARAIAQQADLLCFDEPFAGIDKKTEEIIFDILSELKQNNKIIVVISHDLGENLEYYDRFLLLNKKIIAVGSKTDVLTRENLKNAYGQVMSLVMV
ncbi:MULTISPECIES: metal ABC transporter ATP-binding protein [unclassified Coleofasciculus]|uniref:metal ABC transporter ATP-binding protein n=1 Tax=unclassified Coleofasciculus TaxID=2692782 RepID=UPI00188133CA|nr:MULTISPECIES: metal ABC transporter ATP-binding protein [unclassified Coleofasciculus]MBE9128059.1 metal ABC transporter ATP-binding protein [Coleofasciculus sp. LEGE 07081]MBE9149338.1 metal ABC transporter ATP-binding protein [Coleofasciculus sp. LEGE 07092]